MQSKNEQISTLTALTEELENYFTNTIIPQLFVDADLILRKFTPPAMKQFSLKAEHIGRPLSEVRENLRFPTIIDNIKHVITTGEILEKEIQTTDMRWFQMNILPYVVKRGGKTNGVIITFVDITPRIKDLKEQEKLTAEYELLLDTIAHDIKNPLTSLNLSVEMLRKLPEKGMNRFPLLMDKVESSLGKLETIISELINSRLQDHQQQAAEELVDLQSILEDVRVTLAQQVQESNAEIRYEIEVTQITFVRRKLRSVVYNLISNAIKYRSEEAVPKIRVKSFKEDGHLVISVLDNGIGIHRKDHGLIFEKYGRAGKTAEGHGVGLYLVKEIVTRSGGKITVESTPGKGSDFRVYLKLDE